MSSTVEIDTESPPLFNYLRQEIPLEDMRDYASPQRINSIDVVKGFAIILIMMAHTAAAWLNSEWVFLYAILFAALDILGPSLFVFLSALSVIFSIKRKEGKIPKKIVRNRILSRGATIIFIGIIFNLAGFNQAVRTLAFPLNLWGWNILMFLGFSQVFSYYALKLRKQYRAFIGLAIIFISMPLREFLFLNKGSDPLIWILHYVITSPAPQLPVFPWISICFISTIFGEYLYEAMIVGTKDAYIGLNRIFFIWGIVLIISGVAVGWTLQTPETMSVEEYLQLDLLRIMNQQDYFRIPGMPEFLIRGTAGNMLYNLGAALLIIAIVFNRVDIKEKENDFYRMLIYYGKISLSLFLIHYFFIGLFIGQLDVVVFLFVVFAFVGFLGFSMYIWNEYGNGLGSPEWIMIQISRIGQKTGEQVKKELYKTEVLIKNFSKMILPPKTIQKMEDFIQERKEKRLEKKRKKEEREKMKKFHKKLGYNVDKD
ncbi:MAG: DUF1624 domain-containing protein [Candidatus Lokiarchaeota archaeon]|nr:DUF1624 domain-containing protein [Candidatus Lokiarchaeota archaeon]MBD3342302.1 DUF1624 domain-containing protein [Candidatus Lokiarchaeota archaeon]